MVFVEGIAVSGSFMKGAKDKRFAVAAKPYYTEIPSLNNPSESKRVLTMTILLYGDRSMLEYYPNKTSIKTMTALWGFEMDNWVGKIFEFEVTSQKVMGQMKDVLFVKNEKFEEVMPLEAEN